MAYQRTTVDAVKLCDLNGWQPGDEVKSPTWKYSRVIRRIDRASGTVIFADPHCNYSRSDLYTLHPLTRTVRRAAGRLVILESPYAGDVEGNVEYLHRCIRECALRGDSPYASHLMLTGGLRDGDPGERSLGIMLGLRWRRAADCALFYVDRGWSSGMQAAREVYLAEGKPFEVWGLGEGVPRERVGFAA